MANEPWASDANYPAGSDPWSGTPTKSAPSAGEIAAGHVPGVPDPAEVENWWKNRADTRIDALEDAIIDSIEHWQPLQAVGNIVTNIVGSNLGGQQGLGVETTADAAILTNVCTVDIRPGDIITDIAVDVDPSGAAQAITVSLVGFWLVGAVWTGHLVTLTITNPPAGPLRYDHSNAVLTGGAYTVLPGTFWFWTIGIGDHPTKMAAVAVAKNR